MKIHQKLNNANRLGCRGSAAMTLIEVMVALVIAGLVLGGIVGGYYYCVRCAEWSALSLAANARAQERVEQIRSASWNTVVWPNIDQLVATNFSNSVVTLDLSGSGSGKVFATNMTLITQISTNPPLKRVRVDCIWRLSDTSRIFTNTIELCRGPDQ